MLARDHALSGALAFAAAGPLLHVSALQFGAGLIFTAGAGVLPDVDEPGSLISRQGGFLTMGLAWVVHRVSGGHRKGTHALAGIAVFTAATWLAVRYDRAIAAQVALTLFLALLLAAGLHAARLGRFRLGGHHGDVAALGASAAAVHWHAAALALAPLCVALGAFAHVLGDELTHSGCPLAYPFSKREYHLLPGPLRFTTGKWTEHWIVPAVLTLALILTLATDTGLTAHLLQYAHQSRLRR